MSQYNKQPSNLNTLSPLSFRFQVQKAPAVSYFCQNAAIPSVRLPMTTQQPGPFATIKRPSTNMEFDDLRIAFLVDEELENWREIFDWMVEGGFPEKFSQFNEDEIFYDATLTVLTNKENPLFRFYFKDCFPTDLGELEFNTTDNDTEIKSTATFAYTRYIIEKV